MLLILIVGSEVKDRGFFVHKLRLFGARVKP